MKTYEWLSRKLAEAQEELEATSTDIRAAYRARMKFNFFNNLRTALYGRQQ